MVPAQASYQVNIQKGQKDREKSQSGKRGQRVQMVDELLRDKGRRWGGRGEEGGKGGVEGRVVFKTTSLMTSVQTEMNQSINESIRGTATPEVDRRGAAPTYRLTLRVRYQAAPGQALGHCALCLLGLHRPRKMSARRSFQNQSHTELCHHL